ncbi:MAG: L,D-transpeptidase family protein [Patescibacteria group bacterium]
MRDKKDSHVRLLSFKDDQPEMLRGSLIPRSVREKQKSPTFKKAAMATIKVVAPVAAVAVMAFVAVSSYGLVAAKQQVATPTVTIIDQDTTKTVTLSYGPQAAFSQEKFFNETREAFIEKSISFIEVDFETKMVRHFKDGVLTISAPVLSFGQEGSWFDAPSGLYEVESNEKRDFSSLAQVYFPYAITFEGNYAIHGVPEYPDGSPVKEDFVAGGIRIANTDAEKLHQLTTLGTPVLVYKKAVKKDHFVYAAEVMDVSAPHYLVADIDSGTMLAASDLRIGVPIASVTKLMTAVVTAEKLDLDSRIQVGSPNFVESLIPRLQDRNSASLYSLLQLLLVESSNEAAEVIAGEYGRSEFIKEMNTKAKQIGMLESNFVDPSGLGNGNTSTLADLFRLTQYIHINRNFIFEITAKEKLTGVRDTGEFSDLANFNEVDEMNNFVGGKIGETTAAGQTSISLHEVSIQGSKRTVAIILLGSTGRDADVRTLMTFVEEQYRR